MKLAKFSNKKRITSPVSIRNQLQRNIGDKIAVYELPAMLAFQKAEKDFSGEAQKAGFQTEEALQDYMKEIRKEIRGY